MTSGTVFSLNCTSLPAWPSGYLLSHPPTPRTPDSWFLYLKHPQGRQEALRPAPLPRICPGLPPENSAACPCVSETSTGLHGPPGAARTPWRCYSPGGLTSCWFQSCLMSELVLRLYRGNGGSDGPAPTPSSFLVCLSNSSFRWSASRGSTGTRVLRS